MKNVNQNIAAIDVGTNSFHLIVVKTKKGGGFEIIDREREVIRLGEGSSGNIKFIKPEVFGRAIATLKRFKGIADSHGAVVRAVATSAVREAYNKNEFIQKVLKGTGIEIEVISGYEEARLIYLGIMKAVPIYNKKVLVIDIGGGSTEFLIGNKGNTNFSISLKIGAVRLTEKFFPDYVVTDSRIKECKKWIEVELVQAASIINRLGFSTCVGSSGTIMSTGLIIQAMRKGNSTPGTILNNFEFTRKELEKVKKEILSKKTVEKRKKIPGLDEKRADIVPAGIIILSTIFELLNLHTMTISGYALREGIVIDSLQKLHTDSSMPNLSDIRNESVRHLAESCKYDHLHCSHIAKLSVDFFDQLKNLHKLDDECKEYLSAAAMLHDIGYHISHTNHHQHSFYIIKNSELLGFNENEISIIAHTARYHRKSHPKSRHEDFNLLSPATQDVIKKLSAMLRVVDAFDRTHKQLVKSIKTKINKSSVDLTLKCQNGIIPEIELWNLERRKGLFEEIFSKKIIVKILSA